MEWRPILDPSELETSYTLFPNLKNRLYAKVVGSLLSKIGGFLGYPLGVLVPPDVAEFKGDPENLRALRLLDKFRAQGFIGSFYNNQHSYGDEPHGYVTMASLNSIRRFGFSGKGADMFDRSRTLWPAVGEAVERYAMQFNYPKEGEYVDASWNELSEPKVDIFSIAGFDESLRKRGHHEFKLQYDKDTKFRWVKASVLPDQKDIWAPLQWFSFTHVQQNANRQKEIKHVQEPLLSIPITTGVAAGQDQADATLRGLLEVIERDAFMIYWLNQLTAKQIDLSTLKNPRIKKLEEIAKKYRLELYTLYLQTDVPVHTVGCILIDRSGIGPALLVGAKTSLDLEDAVYSVLSDTLAQRGLYRRMMDSDEYRKQNFEDINKIGHVERIYYWFPVERLKHIDQFIAGNMVDVTSLPSYGYSGDNTKDLSGLLKFFQQKDYLVICRELLNDKLKELTEGLSVVMVKVPKMQPLYLEESLASLGGERLFSVPEHLGFKRKGSTAEFYKVPHPFP